MKMLSGIVGFLAFLAVFSAFESGLISLPDSERSALTAFSATSVSTTTTQVVPYFPSGSTRFPGDFTSAPDAPGSGPGTVIPEESSVSPYRTQEESDAAPSVKANDAAPRVLLPVSSGTVTVPSDFQPAPRTDSVSPIPKDQVPQYVAPNPQFSGNEQPAPGAVREEKPKDRITEVGSSLRDLQREVRKVENTVRERVSQDVDSALMKAGEPDARAFDATERARLIRDITSKLSQDVRDAIAAGSRGDDIETVLKSSLEELQLLIKSSTGVDVDLSPTARTLTQAVAANTEGLTQARNELLNRGGLDLYKDDDSDGVSNYDEQHIYGTDPQNAYTARTPLTDGERVLLGFDPLSNSAERIPVESPLVSGDEVTNVFEVHTISVTLSSNSDETPLDAPPLFSQSVTFSGRALPNSFVTLYIFSTPVVVTVKADTSGSWTYTLDTELPDGGHELYVATVDGAGRILAKSPAVPFVKRAEAAEFTPLLIPELESEVGFVDILQKNLGVVGVVLLSIFILIALIILGITKSRPEGPGMTA